MSDDEYASPKRKSTRPKKRKSRADDDEDDFDAGIAHEDDDYQGPTKRSKGAVALTPDEKERFVGEIVRYILLSETTKTYAARTDIAKIVLQPHGVSKQLTSLLPLAEDKIKLVFGWELVPISGFTEKGKFAAKGTKDMTTRLTSQLEEFMAPIRDELPTPTNYPFLMIVLSLILMHNFSLEETPLYKELSAFGFQQETPHPAFDNKTPSELLRDLAKQHYLSIKKTVEGGFPSTMINIGSRSLIEIGKTNILKFINAICKTSVDPSAFKEFLTEQEAFLPTPAQGENIAAPVPAPAAAAAPEQNGQANGNAEEQADEIEVVQPARGRAKRTSTGSAGGDAPASQGRRRR